MCDQRLFMMNLEKTKLKSFTANYYTLNNLTYLQALKLIHGTPLQYSCLENPMDGGAW